MVDNEIAGRDETCPECADEPAASLPVVEVSMMPSSRAGFSSAIIAAFRGARQANERNALPSVDDAELSAAQFEQVGTPQVSESPRRYDELSGPTLLAHSMVTSGPLAGQTLAELGIVQLQQQPGPGDNNPPPELPKLTKEESDALKSAILGKDGEGIKTKGVTSEKDKLVSKLKKDCRCGQWVAEWKATKVTLKKLRKNVPTVSLPPVAKADGKRVARGSITWEHKYTYEIDTEAVVKCTIDTPKGCAKGLEKTLDLGKKSVTVSVNSKDKDPNPENLDYEVGSGVDFTRDSADKAAAAKQKELERKNLPQESAPNTEYGGDLPHGAEILD